MASLQRPEVSRTAYHISCELRMELYFVFSGWFWQIKKSILPSAEIVGLNSGSCVLIFSPRFSILMIVSEVMIFSFCGFNAPNVSEEGWANTCWTQVINEAIIISFFKGVDLASACKIAIISWESTGENTWAFYHTASSFEPRATSSVFLPEARGSKPEADQRRLQTGSNFYRLVIFYLIFSIIFYAGHQKRPITGKIWPGT